MKYTTALATVRFWVAANFLYCLPAVDEDSVILCYNQAIKEKEAKTMSVGLSQILCRLPELLARAAVGDPWAIALLAIAGIAAVDQVRKHS